MTSQRTIIAVLATALAVVGAVALCLWSDGQDDPVTLPSVTPSASVTVPSPGTSAAPTPPSVGEGIVIDQPAVDSLVSSPLTVTGTVPGTWMFEASFGVELLDASRAKVAETYASATGEWMTEDPVGFTSSITFTAPTSDRGFLVLHKANPSGDADRDDSVEIPIRFR